MGLFSDSAGDKSVEELGVGARGGRVLLDLGNKGTNITYSIYFQTFCPQFFGENVLSLSSQVSRHLSNDHPGKVIFPEHRLFIRKLLSL